MQFYYLTLVTAENTLKTSLYDEHISSKAKMVPFAGWLMPIQYEGIVKEHQAVREAAGLFDVSHMGQLHFEGEGAKTFLDWLVTNRVEGLDVGKAAYTLICNERGQLLDDLIVYRFQEQTFRVVCNASNHDKVVAHIHSMLERWKAEKKLPPTFEDVGHQTALIALQGKASFPALKNAGVSKETLSVPRFGLKADQIEGVTCIFARTGYTGEDGFEIFCDAKDAPSVWKKLSDKGAALGLVPVGLGARDTLRLEACLPLFGHEIDENISPFEARLGWAVKLDKDDFVGKSILQKKKEEGLSRKMVGFEMVGRGIARHGHSIVDSAGKEIGTVTSGSPSPTLGKAIGLGYVPLDFASVGTEIWVEVRGKQIPAKVTNMPFYKKV